MKKVLVTGGTGDVGKVVCEVLNIIDLEVFLLCRRGTDSGNCVKGDLLNPASLLDATKGMDVVVHIAGLTKGKKTDLMAVNALGTQNLVSACNVNKVGGFIFISSLDVKFDTPYAESKRKAEEFVVSSGLRYMILRPAVIYGKRFQKDIAKLVQLLKKVPFMPVFGSGKNLYQPLLVHDLADVVKKIVKDDLFLNKQYYLGGAEPVSMNSLIDLICSKLSRKVIKVHAPEFFVKAALFVIDSFALNMNLRNFLIDKVCNNDSAIKEIGFCPTSIKDGLDDLICSAG